MGEVIGPPLSDLITIEVANIWGKLFLSRRLFILDVDGDIVDGGCNGVVLRDGVIGEKGVGGDADEGDGVMSDDDKSSTTRVTRTVLTDIGVLWEGVYW